MKSMTTALETRRSQLSGAEMLDALSSEQRRKWFASLSDEEAEAIVHDWEFWARSKQLEPTDRPWVNWLVMAGRGFGKTRMGSEQVRKWVKDFPIVNLIGPTASDVRDVMVEGIGAGSAIMEVCRRDERPVYQKSHRRLVWPNGAISLLFSAEEPERLRGPQHMKVWSDELAAWKYPDEAWEQMEFGLRLGPNPQVVITTTPKPTRLIKSLAASEETVITHGSTYDNQANLAKKFYEKIIRKYEGTRLGRQELMAELLEDRPGALWTLQAIDADRVPQCPAFLTRVVVGVDPAVTSGDDSAEWGIVVVGMGPNPNGQVWPPHFYVMDDLSGKFSPNEAAKRAVYGYRAHKVDRIVAEVNNGGDLVEAVLRNVDHSFAYKAVHASRGKLTRAEPIAALYEQHRVHHVGAFGVLEDQICDYIPSVSKSPDRMDALVWALTELSGDDGEDVIYEYSEIRSISPELEEMDDLLDFWVM
jgi:phage terminase large subunit-like protein